MTAMTAITYNFCINSNKSILTFIIAVLQLRCFILGVIPCETTIKNLDSESSARRLPPYGILLKLFWQKLGKNFENDVKKQNGEQIYSTARRHYCFPLSAFNCKCCSFSKHYHYNKKLGIRALHFFRPDNTLAPICLFNILLLILMLQIWKQEDIIDKGVLIDNQIDIYACPIVPN